MFTFLLHIHLFSLYVQENPSSSPSHLDLLLLLADEPVGERHLDPLPLLDGVRQPPGLGLGQEQGQGSGDQGSGAEHHDGEGGAHNLVWKGEK